MRSTSISPIKDFTGNLILEFGEHSLGEPKYTIEECRERDMTYSAPLRVRVRLITAESGEIKGIPDQEIFMGDFPLMTDKGTFMINGAERVIVSQLVRSPGVYFSQDVDTNSVRRSTRRSSRTAALGSSSKPTTERRTTRPRARSAFASTRTARSTCRRSSARSRAPISGSIGKPTKRSSNCSTTVRSFATRSRRTRTSRPSEDALKEIYKKLRPGEPENAENAEKLLESLFFDEKRYDLGRRRPLQAQREVHTASRTDVRRLEEPSVSSTSTPTPVSRCRRSRRAA